jgi:formate-dependent nitrite reductase cytochrome c552 subunit
MTCHSQIWKDSPLIKPIQDSYRTGKPIEWNRVHDLPDFAYFNHSIHVQKGVSCVSCHGRVDKMPMTWKEKDLSMAWCLDCHRKPEKYLRPREQVYNLGWKPSEPQEQLGKELIKKYHVLSELQLTSCSTCHH